MNLDMMQMVLQQVPVLIVVLTAIVTLASVSPPRTRLVLKR
jgi:hypothetical protein